MVAGRVLVTEADYDNPKDRQDNVSRDPECCTPAPFDCFRCDGPCLLLAKGFRQPETVAYIHGGLFVELKIREF